VEFPGRAYRLRSSDPAGLRGRLEQTKPWYAAFLKRWLPADRSARMLDVPSGAGNLLFALQSLGYENVLGVDSDEGQVAFAKGLGLPAVAGDAFAALGAEAPGTVARVFSIDFLEHVPPPAALEFCEKAHRALEPGGVLVCRTPSADGPFGAHDRYNDLTHCWAMSANAASQLMQVAGFAQDKIQVIDEAPVPYKWQNRIRLQVFRLSTTVASRWLEFSGIGAPRIWTRSMWIIAQRD
jgi:SAM-dependent methyltransferase